MPKVTQDPRKAGPHDLENDKSAKAAFDPGKLKGPHGPKPGKHLVQGAKRLQVPGKGRAR